MMLHRLKVAGLLSFGPKGVDLPMAPLNVLIGPNGSGKSNLLAVIALLRSATSDLAEPIARRGGPDEFFWKGPDTPPGAAVFVHGQSGTHTAHVEAIVDSDFGVLPGTAGSRFRQARTKALQHVLKVASYVGQIGVVGEHVVPLDAELHRSEGEAFERSLGSAIDEPASGRQLPEVESSSPQVTKISAHPSPVASMLRFSHAQLELLHLKDKYEAIRLYRNWSFGPDAPLRTPCGAHGRSDFLDEDGGNLALVLSQFFGDHKRAVLGALRSLYDGIVDFRCPVTGGTVGLFLEEEGNRAIPATLLSDGTLRYLCLLAVLLHPKPPPLICIEEPELGLHPDLLPTLSDLMLDASKFTQLVVTTHSDVIVDALTDHPESVVICEKHDGETEMRRLDKADLSKWLKDYGLGRLWTDGELGGNRW